MPRILCFTGIVVSILVALIFLLDLVALLGGVTGLAPFRGASWLMDVLFVICGAILGYLSYSTLREQD